MHNILLLSEHVGVCFATCIWFQTPALNYQWCIDLALALFRFWWLTPEFSQQHQKTGEEMHKLQTVDRTILSATWSQPIACDWQNFISYHFLNISSLTELRGQTRGKLFLFTLKHVTSSIHFLPYLNRMKYHEEGYFWLDIYDF